jgi:2-polyprenyl-3-methyl-5-hydroxy-6-metoxy-1,4-benzoquinol methylase
LNEEIIIANRIQTCSESDQFTCKRYQSFYKYLGPSKKTILDFGCNTGRGGEVLKKLNSDYIIYGADILKERLDKVPKGVYSKVIDLSAKKIGYYFKNLDAIVAGEVVEHIPLQEFKQYLLEFFNVLSPGGILLLTTPNPESIWIKIGRRGVFKDPSHINLMKPQILISLLKKTGFWGIRIKGSGRAINYIGEQFPIVFYGSYLVIANK